MRRGDGGLPPGPPAGPGDLRPAGGGPPPPRPGGAEKSAPHQRLPPGPIWRCARGASHPGNGIDAPLGPKPGSPVEQMVRPDGKSARTRYGSWHRWAAVRPGAPGAGHRPHPPDPGAYGPPGPPAGGRLSLRKRGARTDPTVRPSLTPPNLPTPHQRTGDILYSSAAPGYGAAFGAGRPCMKKPWGCQTAAPGLCSVINGLSASGWR